MNFSIFKKKKDEKKAEESEKGIKREIHCL